jgi:hypothetical protein
MDEDRLTPQMGRLIDQAKAAALRVTAPGMRAEGVALLTGDGSIYSGHPGEDPALPTTSAAEVALACARRSACAEISAAAIAVANESGETVLPGDGSRAVLAAIDPDLPVVFKHHGRWVLRLLSQLPDPSRSAR